MQKKKKYYEIKDGGVTLYWDMTANVLVDIDVQPGVKTVNLFAEKTASKYLYSTYRVKLENVYKQFPDVEELHIEGDIQQVSIRNDMFPNVKLVKSDSDRFVDGASMLIEVLYNMNRKLLNAFYMQPDMELDLKNIKYIADYALNGYMSVIALFLDHYKIGTRTKLMNILKYGYAELKKEIGDDNAYELLRDYMDTGVSIMRAEHMPKTFGIRFKFDFDGEEE